MRLVDRLRMRVDAPLLGRLRAQLLVLDDVLEEEHHVVGGEGLAVRPLVPLAQLEGDRLCSRRSSSTSGRRSARWSEGRRRCAPAPPAASSGCRRCPRSARARCRRSCRRSGRSPRRAARSAAAPAADRRPAAACRPSRRRRRAGSRPQASARAVRLLDLGLLREGGLRGPSGRRRSGTRPPGPAPPGRGRPRGPAPRSRRRAAGSVRDISLSPCCAAVALALVFRRVE